MVVLIQGAVDDVMYRVRGIADMQLSDIVSLGVIILLIVAAIWLVIKVASKLIKLVVIVAVVLIILAVFFNTDPFGIASYIQIGRDMGRDVLDRFTN